MAALYHDPTGQNVFTRTAPMTYCSGETEAPTSAEVCTLRARILKLEKQLAEVHHVLYSYIHYEYDVILMKYNPFSSSILHC